MIAATVSILLLLIGGKRVPGVDPFQREGARVRRAQRELRPPRVNASSIQVNWTRLGSRFRLPAISNL